MGIEFFFISAIGRILEEIKNLPGMYLLLAIVTISLIIHIIYLMKWFDKRAKNEELI